RFVEYFGRLVVRASEPHDVTEPRGHHVNVLDRSKWFQEARVAVAFEDLARQDAHVAERDPRVWDLGRERDGIAIANREAFALRRNACNLQLIAVAVFAFRRDDEEHVGGRGERGERLLAVQDESVTARLDARLDR